ncbi:hypothetical protein SUGI_1066220 [Cryptomeria japonica]|uniref:uncharacterized protein LOC131029956 isoform X2 n=1 Tax=Cryptomeria japonica TaxID=3369 RepID=UPI0024148611|nr:uncharacterized protein LOC131029956 isoform X2 [Cryptomeria japonica]GLJ50116.1 hypothetical protein SUGI_1066220 [Cryptomeria japonica]
MKGILYYCSVGAAAMKVGRVLVIIMLLLAVLISFRAPGASGMRNSVGIRHRMDAGHGGVKFDKGAKADLNYGNVKRRVPNGSDPIHNRAGKSGEPPAV